MDTGGDHWGEVLWDVYRHFRLPVAKEDFRAAYIQGERTLGKQPLVQPHFHFRDVLRVKLDIQLEHLVGNGKLTISSADRERLALSMADYADGCTREVLADSEGLLRRLKERYKLVLVSNFYGNIRTVLQDAGLLSFFEQVVESAVVGVRKPNPAIFALGVCALDLRPTEVAVVGDSFPKDIEPAHRLGCRTVWLKGRQWEDKEEDGSLADITLSRLADIEEWL